MKAHLMRKVETYINKIADSILKLFLIYVFLVLASFLISSNAVDKAFAIHLKKSLGEKQCPRYSQRIPAPLRIWDFYGDLDYWLADFHVSRDMLAIPECAQIIFEEAGKYPKAVSIYFAN